MSVCQTLKIIYLARIKKFSPIGSFSQATPALLSKRFRVRFITWCPRHPFEKEVLIGLGQILLQSTKETYFLGRCLPPLHPCVTSCPYCGGGYILWVISFVSFSNGLWTTINFKKYSIIQKKKKKKKKKTYNYSYLTLTELWYFFFFFFFFFFSKLPSFRNSKVGNHSWGWPKGSLFNS